MKTILKFALLLCLAAAFSCKKKDMPLAKITPMNLDSIAANYYEQYLKMHPLEATAQGDYRYNDQLPVDIDKDFIDTEVVFYKGVQKQLEKVDYEKLPDDKRVIFDVLEYTLKDKIERFAHHPEYIPFTQLEGLPLTFPLLGSGSGNQPFETEKDYDDWLSRMEKFPLWMDAAVENFNDGIAAKTVLPKKLVLRMIAQTENPDIISDDFERNIFYGPVKNFPQNFSDEQKEKYTKLYKAAISEKIIPAYKNMAGYLKTTYLNAARDSDGINGIANGDKTYRYYVKSWTTTNLSPEEIHETGLKEVAELRSEMEKVKAELGFQGTLEEFLASLKTDPKAMPYKTADEVLGAFNSVLKKIQPKLKTMFSVTPKTPFEIRQTEKFRESTASAEYMQGSADGKRPGIFYLPLPEPKVFNVASGMESLFLHEAIPGHHYQISIQQENEDLPKFMRFGWLGAYGEGWAHYCETLGPELGLYTDPYQKMGYLSDQMLRAVRLVIDTGIHSGKMTREEAIAYFLKNVAYDENSATAEIERYMALPGQALAYKVGSLKIKELRGKYSAKLGKNFALPKFHDEVLSQGCLPLAVLERKMENWAAHQEKGKK